MMGSAQRSFSRNPITRPISRPGLPLDMHNCTVCTGCTESVWKNVPFLQYVPATSAVPPQSTRYGISPTPLPPFRLGGPRSFIVHFPFLHRSSPPSNQSHIRLSPANRKGWRGAKKGGQQCNASTPFSRASADRQSYRDSKNDCSWYLKPARSQPS